MTLSSKFVYSVSIFIFVLCSIVLHYNIFSVPKYQDIDSKAYMSNALTFFNSNNQKSSDPYYALGYAFFLSIIYTLFGVNNVCVVWVQVLLALLTMWLLFKVTRNFFGNTVALIAMLLFSVNLGFLVFSQFILTEILLTFFYVLFIERFSVFLKTGRLFGLLGAGFVLGLSVAVKPAAIYFIFPLGVLTYFMCNYKIKNVLLLCLSFYIPVCGYMMFNKINYGTFEIAPLGNENLYLYLYPKVLAQKNGTDYWEEKKKVAALLAGNKLDSKSWANIKKQFFQDFKKTPALFLRIWLKNVFKTCVGLFTTNLKVLIEPQTKGGDISFFKTKGNIFERVYDYVTGGTNSFAIKTIGFIEAFWTVLRYLFCAIAVVFLCLKKKWAGLLFFMFYILYFAMITGHDGCARFRMMFEPALLSLSSLGMWVMICKKNIL